MMQRKPKCLFNSIATVFIISVLSSVAPAIAWDSEIRVNGELIPAELMAGYRKHQTGVESHCPPLSDIRDRDLLVLHWVRAKVAEERGLQMDERGNANTAELEEELLSDQAKVDDDYRDKYLWLLLSHKSNAYWSSTIGQVTDQEIAAEYNRLVKNMDPRFVNAPLFKLMIMESYNEQRLQKLADRLHAGETWRQVSVDIDPLDWNSHNKDMWFTFDRLDRYRSKAFNALELDSGELQRGDVIGPLSEVKRYRLVVILDKTVEPIIPIDAKLMNLSKWAHSEVRGDLYAQRHRALGASLLENVEVTENGKPVTISLEHERCPG